MQNTFWLRHGALAVALTIHAGSAIGIDTSVASPPREPKSGRSAHGKEKKTQPPAQPKLNGLAQTAVNAGIVDCVPRIQQVTDFLTANTKSGAFLFIAPAEANRHIVSTSLEIQTKGASSYASASFAPGGSSGCGTLYETVSYWVNRCEDVAQRAFPGFPPAGKLGETITMLDAGSNLRIFLMPAGQGCLSIKKEMVY